MREFLILIIFVFFYWVRTFFMAAKIALITSILVPESLLAKLIFVTLTPIRLSTLRLPTSVMSRLPA